MKNMNRECIKSFSNFEKLYVLGGVGGSAPIKYHYFSLDNIQNIESNLYESDY